MTLLKKEKKGVLLLLAVLVLFGIGCVPFRRFRTCIQNLSLKEGEKEKKAVIRVTDGFFLQPDQLFSEGRYRRALRSLRQIYREAVDRSVKEEALFRMVLILSYGDNPNRDYEEAEKRVREFLHDYPDSRRTLTMRSVLQLLQEVRRGEAEIETIKGYNSIQEKQIHRLKEDLRRIKEIDLQLEEQKKKLE
ncbi:MAG: hypothetical protein GXP58_07600 [Deltaproteobacteria bacterium]|nr:hypothetical protein [Deltaproteobacteria bacterium]